MTESCLLTQVIRQLNSRLPKLIYRGFLRRNWY